MFRAPEKLTPESLAALMKDPRYSDRRDREHKAYRDFVTRAYRSFYGEAGGGALSGAARAGGGIVHVRGYTRAVDGKIQHVQAYDRRGPWSDRPIAEFRQSLATAETSAVKTDDGYGDFRANSGGHELDTLGRYQLQRYMLKKAGWLDENYKWSEKARQHGVTSDQKFLQNPEAQETALEDVLPLYEREAQQRGFFERARNGEKIPGRRGEITVTDAGIVAAMHREGGPNVAKYFVEADRAKQARRRLKYDKKGVFEHIETRLRTFQDVPYTRMAPPSASRP